MLILVKQFWNKQILAELILPMQFLMALSSMALSSMEQIWEGQTSAGQIYGVQSSSELILVVQTWADLISVEPTWAEPILVRPIW